MCACAMQIIFPSLVFIKNNWLIIDNNNNKNVYLWCDYSEIYIYTQIEHLIIVYIHRSVSNKTYVNKKISSEEFSTLKLILLRNSSRDIVKRVYCTFDKIIRQTDIHYRYLLNKLQIMTQHTILKINLI